MNKTVLLSTAYWPNLHYFYYVINAAEVNIEQHDSYQKQSYRNRARILSANGVLDLNIPVKKGNDGITGVEISYKEDWQRKHWRAITSAYKNSPYFDFFEKEIEIFYERQYPRLLEYNTLQFKTILKILRLKKEIGFTNAYEKTPQALDLRHHIHPKINFENDTEAAKLLLRPYYQTFQYKFGFVPNLSILDLLFNTGMDTVGYLRS